MAQLNYSDFYQVPNLKFNIKQLREDLEAASRRNSMERNKEESEFQQELINKVPLGIYIG